MSDIPTIETRRLKLRPHRIEDFEAFAALWTEPAVIRFLSLTPLSREAAWVRFLRQAGQWHYLGFGYLAVEDRETGRFIGEVGFQDMRRDVTPSIEGTMEAGWLLASAAHGRGLAVEAMQAALGWADAHGTGDRITCLIHPDHEGSLRLAAKLGFVVTGNSTYNGNPIVMLERPRPGPEAV
jgi:RimJ/RimL family protein N-acetyltransferase